MLAPESRCAPGDFALLDHRDRDFAELLGQLRLVLEQLHQFVGAGEPGGATADDRDADLDPILRRNRSAGRSPRRGSNGGGNSLGATAGISRLLLRASGAELALSRPSSP